MKKDDVTITCIACPNGCDITVSFDENGNVAAIKGNKCKNGITYATDEVTHPTRILTTSVLVNNGEFKLASVKTTNPIPKELMRKAVMALMECSVDAPLKVGDVVFANLLDTGVDVVSTCNVEAKK